MLNIKIFVAHNKENSITVDNSLYQNIKVGYIDSSTKFISDNTGDNISTKYDKYCELTAQYWAWKNTDADYYGLCTENKYLSFAKNDIRNNINKLVKYPYLNKEPIVEAPIKYEYLNSIAIEQMNLFEQPITEEITKYDMLITTPLKFDITVMEQFENYVPSVEDNKLKLTLDVIKELSPEMYPNAESYINGNVYYPGQLYIMKKDLFHEYCTWSFAILEEIEKCIDFTNYSEEGLKILYHIGERLLGIYYSYLKNQNKYNIKELDWCTIENPAAPEELPLPVFSDNKEGIVLSFSNEYIIGAGATILSVVNSSNKKNKYDIICLHKNLSEKNKNLLYRIIKDKENFSLRFYDVGYKISNYSLYLPHNEHWSIQNYFKLLIPYIFKNYNKILYLDSDLIVLENIIKLLNLEINGYAIAAPQELNYIYSHNNFSWIKEYNQKILELKNVFNYFSVGVVIFNIIEINKFISEDALLKTASRAYLGIEEHILNKIFQEKVYLLDISWNVTTKLNISAIENSLTKFREYAPLHLYNNYLKARKHPKIIHYVWKQKPWNYPNMDFAQYWWDTVRGTELYELAINSQIINITTNYTKKTFKDCSEMLENKKGW
ncbi:hypothetical protein AN641_06070 [Candidatus Epulonipiscioides gigas]|nr:hypothetical protein AN641_06070 [Epulopiscium sp. SCG-C07WGA-EpuloA2]